MRTKPHRIVDTDPIDAATRRALGEETGLAVDAAHLDSALLQLGGVQPPKPSTGSRP